MNGEKVIIKSLLLLFVLSCCLFHQADAQDGASLFKQYCATCHKIGSGRYVGPDLKDITSKLPEDWLIRWTKSPRSLINSGDSAARAVFEEFGGLIMPDQDMSDAEIKSVYAYIESQSSESAGNVSTEPVVVIKSSDSASPQDIANGEKLFIGSRRMVNKGPSCISCHNVDYKGIIPGGLLAKDLTTVYSRMGGDAGLHGILGAPPFPAMATSYKSNTITPEEIADIVAFLRKVDTDKAAQQASNKNLLLYWGVGGFCLLMIVYSLIWLRRKRFTVKKDIYIRQLKTI